MLAACVVSRGEPPAQLRVHRAEQGERPRGRRRADRHAARGSSRGPPRIVRSATLRRSRVLAAWRIRSSSPSGSTMWRRSPTARSMSWCSNISGVTARVRATSSRSSSSSRSTRSSNSARAVATLRGDSFLQPATHPRQRLLSRRWCRASWRRSAWWCRARRSAASPARAGRSPPLSTIPAIWGKFADTWAVRTPRTTSGQSPGATTTAPSNRRSGGWGSVMAAITTPVASCASSLSSPLMSLPSQAGVVWASRRCVQQGLLLATRKPVRRSGRARRPHRRRRGGRVRPVGHDREQGAEVGLEPAGRHLGCRRGATTEGGLPCALRTSITGVPRLAATRALKENSVGAPTSCSRCRQRRRRRPCRRPGGPVDDPVERGLGVAVRRRRTSRPRARRRSGHGVVRDEKIEDIVDGRLVEHDGAVDRDPLDPAGELSRTPRATMDLPANPSTAATYTLLAMWRQ